MCIYHRKSGAIPLILRMLGSTSDVAQCRNFFALGILLDSTREYRPGSLTHHVSP